jgi:shikimate dehydrogenase
MQAAERGCRVVEGFEMFLGQAMVQFELWTGQMAPAEVMREVVEARL